MSQDQILDLVAVAVAVANPLLVAFVTSAQARSWVKTAVSVMLAVAAGGAAAWGQYQAGSTEWLVLAAAAFGVAQLAYKVADKTFESATGTDLNQQPFLRPDSGIGA